MTQMMVVTDPAGPWVPVKGTDNGDGTASIGGGGGGGGSGTEYTEDAALPANPVGSALIARRRDTLTPSEVSADGDAIALNATPEGELRTHHRQLPAFLGPQTAANSLSVAPASDGAFNVVGNNVVADATFTRPADTTAYASGDLVANSTTAGSVVPMTLTVARVAAGGFIIRRLRLRKSGTSLTNASFRVHLFTAAPGTITNGDNGAFSVSGVADYIGSVDITMTRAFTDGAFGDGGIAMPEFNVKLASGTTIRALIEARAAYTPASGETFTVRCEALQN